MTVGTHACRHMGTRGCLASMVLGPKVVPVAASARHEAPQGARSCPSHLQVECNSKLDPTNTTFLKVSGW